MSVRVEGRGGNPMDAALIDRLCRASEAKRFDPVKDVPWDVPFDEREPQAVPDSLLSLSGRPEFAALSRDQRRTLARHEIATLFSIFVRFEGLLNENLARAIQKIDPADPFVAYALHVIEEEGRHSRMFVRLVEATGVGSYPPLALIFDRIVPPPYAYRRAGIVRSQREAWGISVRRTALLTERADRATLGPDVSRGCGV